MPCEFICNDTIKVNLQVLHFAPYVSQNSITLFFKIAQRFC